MNRFRLDYFGITHSWVATTDDVRTHMYYAVGGGCGSKIKSIYKDKH